MIPDSLSKDFVCSCKTNCTARCGCRKLGLKCNKYCKHCKGNECLNSEISDDFSPEILTEEPENLQINVEPFDFIYEENIEDENISIPSDEDSSDGEPPTKILKI